MLAKSVDVTNALKPTSRHARYVTANWSYSTELVFLPAPKDGTKKDKHAKNVTRTVLIVTDPNNAKSAKTKNYNLTDFALTNALITSSMMERTNALNALIVIAKYATKT
jgi:hypothetical protein